MGENIVQIGIISKILTNRHVLQLIQRLLNVTIQLFHCLLGQALGNAFGHAHSIAGSDDRPDGKACVYRAKPHLHAHSGEHAVAKQLIYQGIVFTVSAFTVGFGSKRKGLIVDSAIDACVNVNGEFAVLLLKLRDFFIDQILRIFCHAVTNHVIIASQIGHCHLTVVQRCSQRIKGRQVGSIKVIVDTEIIKRLTVQIVNCTHHFCQGLMLRITEFQIGHNIVLIVELCFISRKFLEHRAEHKDIGGDHSGNRFQITAANNSHIKAHIGKSICACPHLRHDCIYSFQIVHAILIVGHAHGQQGTNTIECSGIALKEKRCIIGFFENAVYKEVAKSFVRVFVNTAIEVELTICSVCKEVVGIISLYEIVHRVQIDLAHGKIFFPVLLNQRLIVRSLVTAIHMHHSNVCDGIVDICCCLIRKPDTNLAGILIQILIEYFVALKKAIRQNQLCFVVSICIDQSNIGKIFFLHSCCKNYGDCTQHDAQGQNNCNCVFKYSFHSIPTLNFILQ